jgi:mono/diheme cytochrome c family protein
VKLRDQLAGPLAVLVSAGVIGACVGGPTAGSAADAPDGGAGEVECRWGPCDGVGSGWSPGSGAVVMDAGMPPFPLFHPTFGATVTLARPPAPLGAATLVIDDGGNVAVATDPDRDRVLVVELKGARRVRAAPLGTDEEPGRVALDATHAHVVLRRAGAVASIELATGTIRDRRAVCGAPQGITRDGATLYVSCAGGEIVTLPTGEGPAPSVLARLDHDLRDVVVQGSDLLVSRLRSAEVLRVRKADGVLLARARAKLSFAGPELEPFVGYRLLATPSGALLVSQMATDAPIEVKAPSSYAAPPGGCGGPVMTTVATFDTTGGASSLSGRIGAAVGAAVLPVDLARAPDGAHVAVIAAGNGHTPQLPQVDLLASGADGWDAELGCLPQGPAFPGQLAQSFDPPGQAVAVAFTPDSATIAVFTREPAALHLRAVATYLDAATTWTTIALGGESREDTGHAIFHSNTGGGIACASCHPGAADDGRVWNFTTGRRRTQTLQGTLQGTAPYHWGGDVPDLETFASEVFVNRMAGQPLPSREVEALRSWLLRIPAPPVSAAADPAAAARGKALFEQASVGCSGCHEGAQLTNSEMADVGTGGAFQVPSLLGVSGRAPYFHDGRVPTLVRRFGPEGGGDQHGRTSHLAPAAIGDLVHYLETL